MNESIGWFFIGFLIGIIVMLLVFMWLFSTFMSCIYEQASNWFKSIFHLPYVIGVTHIKYINKNKK